MVVDEVVLEGVVVLGGASGEAGSIGAELTQGRLVRLLQDYRCVDPAGDDYAVRLVYPDRHLPFRVRLFAEHLLDRWSSGRSPEEEVEHTIPDVPTVVPLGARQTERL